MKNPWEDCLRVLHALIAANDLAGTTLAERAVEAYEAEFREGLERLAALEALACRLDELPPSAIPQGEDFLIDTRALIAMRAQAQMGDE